MLIIAWMKPVLNVSIMDEAGTAMDSIHES